MNTSNNQKKGPTKGCSDRIPLEIAIESGHIFMQYIDTGASPEIHAPKHANF